MIPARLQEKPKVIVFSLIKKLFFICSNSTPFTHGCFMLPVSLVETGSAVLLKGVVLQLNKLNSKSPKDFFLPTLVEIGIVENV